MKNKLNKIIQLAALFSLDKKLETIIPFANSHFSLTIFKTSFINRSSLSGSNILFVLTQLHNST